VKLAVFGATSAIAGAALREAARHGDSLFLVGRNAQRLAAVADDLRTRGASAVHSAEADLDDLARHESLVDEADRALGGLDAALVAHGVLTDEPAARRDFSVAERDYRTNLLSAVSLMGALANRMEPRRAGVIAVLSSVAGDRGRQSNYVYGSAKAGVSAFAAGLRHRLAPSGVKVVTIKPGPVDTPMTAALKKGPMLAPVGPVGESIYRALLRPRPVVYVPGFWRLIMLIIRHVPEALFVRTKL